ncbi:cytochrome P450 [Caballeronia glathei]|uniref:cytochrome P450 n=1 Tax=Caballeronia glathei TaxID=60547 RepID=UPI00126914FD
MGIDSSHRTLFRGNGSRIHLTDSPTEDVLTVQSQTSPTPPADAPLPHTPECTPLFRQPLADLPEKSASSFAFVRAVRRNGLHLWARHAYEADYVEERLFHQKWVLLNKPELVHRVLVGNNGSYARPDSMIRVVRPLGRHGLLLATGERWKLQRRTIAPTLAPKMLPILARHVSTCTDEEIRALAAHDGAPLDLLAAMQTLALKIAARSMFSVTIGDYGPAVRAAMQVFLQRHAYMSFGDLVLPHWMPSLRSIGRAGFRRHWLALIGRIIDARERLPQAGDGPRDLFDALRSARDPETGVGFDRVELCDQVGTMIAAGHEPSALTLYWALYLLANAPDVQDAVAAEVRDVDLTPDRAADALDALPYTRAVISETLRLYPPAWLMTRKCIEPDQFDKLSVTRGTLVIISPWVLHHHRDYWRDPEAFDPARFLPGAPAVPRFAYLPFGTGPRVCVGAQFALAETSLVLARFIQAFETELADNAPVLPIALGLTAPDRLVPFRLKPRRR